MVLHIEATIPNNDPLIIYVTFINMENLHACKYARIYWRNMELIGITIYLISIEM